MSGLKPSRHILIVLVIGVIAAGVLYSLPKFVVKNEPSNAESAQSSSEEKTEEPHVTLSESQLTEINEIRNSNDTEEGIYQNLATYFAGQNLFDSSAYYAEKKANLTNTETDWLLAGDFYFQSYSLALNPIRQEELAEKTREVYQKALAINPNQLHARTNTAMTYVSSASPMQAIMMLRQVLDLNPRYVPAIMSMGALSMQSGQYDKAVGRFEQALSIDSGNLNAQLGLAYSLVELGEKERAKEILEALSQIGLDEVLQNEVNNTLESLK
ncbi:tetratricopeptide repeat protein [Jiulongibacter sp. NS-SX5]|uniref:tetratricopeptide repeat protein n=1 Tax=Jiulongibacter sp. NS-SX5 TaxID=3463854 RepID=UPI00405A464A